MEQTQRLEVLQLMVDLVQMVHLELNSLQQQKKFQQQSLDLALILWQLLQKQQQTEQLDVRLLQLMFKNHQYSQTLSVMLL